ncbi:hypothetical protein [Maricaulis sp.]|uniref:DUF4870 family protein n=1 Tax=Maricaulis sp. TaxID=1486257 RepID=UPI0026371117|nr:hypothetical protein [Maricaulis sp.]
MSDTIIEPGHNASADRDDKLMVALNYVLMLISNIIGVTSIIALIIAYARRENAPNWLFSHYDFQIRTFWIALIGIIACTVLIFTVILSPFGLLGYVAIWLWVLIRNAIGLVRLIDGRGIAQPQTYWV